VGEDELARGQMTVRCMQVLRHARIFSAEFFRRRRLQKRW
jgi:hypothetical protein